MLTEAVAVARINLVQNWIFLKFKFWFFSSGKIIFGRNLHVLETNQPENYQNRRWKSKIVVSQPYVKIWKRALNTICQILKPASDNPCLSKPWTIFFRIKLCICLNSFFNNFFFNFIAILFGFARIHVELDLEIVFVAIKKLLTCCAQAIKSVRLQGVTS